MTKATLDLIESARESNRLAREHLADIKRQIDEATQRRAAILDAPLTKEDWIATLTKSVQRKGTLFAQNLALSFSGERDTLAYREAVVVDSDKFLRNVIAPGFGQMPPVTEGAFCLYAEEGIVAGLKRVAEAMKWPAEAIPMADRPELLKRADALIAELTAQATDLSEALGLEA